MEIMKFIDNDTEYLKWINKHPDGFIVNTRKSENSDYFVLHRSRCHHISSDSRWERGAYTENDYIKIGAEDLQELIKWFRKYNSSFNGRFHECKSCNPLLRK